MVKKPSINEFYEFLFTLHKLELKALPALSPKLLQLAFDQPPRSGAREKFQMAAYVDSYRQLYALSEQQYTTISKSEIRR